VVVVVVVQLLMLLVLLLVLPVLVVVALVFLEGAMSTALDSSVPVIWSGRGGGKKQ
jgi:hypothetical protein